MANADLFIMLFLLRIALSFITISPQQKLHTHNWPTFGCEWSDWCQSVFLKIFFNGFTWIRSQGLHFVQVRVEGSCQTKIPNWRCDRAVCFAGIGSVFIRCDSPLSHPPLFCSLCIYCSPGRLNFARLQRLAACLKSNQACQTISPNSHKHTLTQVWLSYFLVLTLCHLLHRLRFSFTCSAGSRPELVLLWMLAK